MLDRFSKLFDVPTLDPEDARRRTLLNVLLFLLAAGLLLSSIIVLVTPHELMGSSQAAIQGIYLALGIGAVIVPGLYALNRYVSGWLAGALFILLLTLIAALSDEPEQVIRGRGLIMFSLSIFLSSLLLRSWASFPAAALSSLALTGLSFQAGRPLPNLFSILEFFFLAAIAWLSALGLERTTLRLHINITERKQAEDVLRESEERFRWLFTTSPDAILLIDPHASNVSWPIVDCNEVACQMNGYTREELIGQSIDMLNTVPGIREERIAYLDRLRREGVIHVEAFHRHKDGHVFPVEVSTSLFTFEGRELVLGIDRDITERKQAETALTRAEQRYRDLFEEAPVMYVITRNQAGVPLIADCNRSFLDKTGYARDEVLDRPLTDFYTPASRAKLLEDGYRRALAGDVLVEERELLTRDARVIATLLQTKIESNAEGQVIGTRAMYLDITERKQAEITLRESEGRFREIFENMSSGVVVYEAVNGGEDFKINNFNRAAEKIESISRESVIGRTVCEAFPGVKALGLFDVFQRVWKTGNPEHHPTSFYQDDRMAGWRENYVARLPSGEVAAVYDDVTERKQTEEALRESEERFRSLYENSTVGLYRTTPDGRILLANPTLVKIMGYSSFEDLATRNLQAEGFEPSHERAHFLEMIEKEGEVKGLESAWTRGGGTAIFVSESARAIRDAEGRTLYYDGTVEDITERKRAEEEILRLNAELEQRVVERTAQLQAANKQLESEIAERKSEILARVQAEEELKRRVAELSALNAMAAIVTKSLDVDEILNRAMDEALRLVGVEAAAMFLLDAKAGELVMTAHRGVSQEMVKAASRIRLGEGLGGRVAQTGKPIVIGSASEYSGALKVFYEKERLQAGASVPLVGSTGVIGVMSLATATPQYLDVAGVELLVSLGQQIAVGVEKARLYEAVQGELAERKRAEVALRESEERFRRLSEAAFEAIVIHEGGVLLSANDQYSEMFGYEPKELLGKQVMPLTVAPEAIESMRKEITTGGVGPYVSIGLRKDGTKFPMEIRVREMEYGGRKVRVSAIMDITERKRAEEALQQRTTQLEAANKELEAFAYSVSHDLRAPLRAMDGFSRILLEEYAPQLDAEAQRYLQIVRANAQQMGHLIDDLLTFSRLGRQPLNKQPVDMNQLARQALDEVRRAQPDRSPELVSGDLPPCQADPALLRQVWVNLLSNAFKYTAKREQARIEMGCQLDQGQPIYFVRDNGAGFDMQYADKLFGVFQRFHRAEDYEGTGVGLAIVRRIVDRHGGRIWAEAQVDGGATFYFTI